MDGRDGLAAPAVVAGGQEIEAIRRALARAPGDAEGHWQLGRLLRRLGRDREAVLTFQQAVAAAPGHGQAQFSLGHALRACGEPAAALAAFERAALLLPGDAEAHNALAVCRRDAGRLDEAIASFRAAVACDGAHPGARANLGLALLEADRPAEALPLLEAAVAAAPADIGAASSLARALEALGRPGEAADVLLRAAGQQPASREAAVAAAAALGRAGRDGEALGAWQRVVALDEEHAGAHANLGLLLLNADRNAEAAHHLGRATTIDPRRYEAQCNLGLALIRLRRPAIARRVLERAVELSGEPWLARNQLGVALLALDLVEEAEAEIRAALGGMPDRAEIHLNLGLVAAATARNEEAFAAYRRAIDLDPGYHAAYWNLSLALLRAGDFKAGWELYEHRWPMRDPKTGPGRHVQAQWRGEEPVAGRTVLVYTEQGLGDTIHFARYLPLLAARGARIVLECQPALVRLMGAMLGEEATVVGVGEALPAFDLHIPLMSLPLAFGTTIETIPARVPYLKVPQEARQAWGRRLALPAGRPAVGLVWSGNPNHVNDHRRSLPAELLAPLAAVAGPAWVCLQKRRAGAPPGLSMIDPMPEADDMVDTAAILERLDLVIAADTGVAHLAGALGRPAWVMLPHDCDWRWLQGREDSPWYPTLRLFRQERRGDWEGVVRRVARALEERLAAPTPAAPVPAPPASPRAVLKVPPPSALRAAGLRRDGRRADAIAMARACIARAPQDADAWLVLGTCLGEDKEDEAAREALTRAARLAPARADVRANLAIVLKRQGMRAEARACYEAAATLDPANDSAMHLAGALHLEDGAPGEAARWLKRAITIAPGKADHHRELGRALLRLGRPEEAIAAHRRALALAPEDPVVLCCLGVAEIEAGRPADAVASLRRGLAASPEDALLRFNLASALLALGDFAGGWPLYEARWTAKAAELGPRDFAAPLWRGEDLGGAGLLLHAEQGHGDAIQFARYAPLAAARAGRVVVECYPALARLFGSLGGGVEVVQRGAPLPPHAAQAPLMSLPLAFGTTLQTIPAAVPYLQPDPGLVREWDRRLGPKRGIEVGIVASGSPHHKGDALRSIPRAAFRALAGIQGVGLVSLDRPSPADAIAALDPMGGVADFADTAAIMARLDLVITADTAAAHLAGALGRPAWVLLPSAADWRWLVGREDSPWYPTLRLVRQARPGDWGEVMGRVAARLAAMAGGAAAFSPRAVPPDV